LPHEPAFSRDSCPARSPFSTLVTLPLTYFFHPCSWTSVRVFGHSSTARRWGDFLFPRATGGAPRRPAPLPNSFQFHASVNARGLHSFSRSSFSLLTMYLRRSGAKNWFPWSTPASLLLQSSFRGAVLFSPFWLGWVQLVAARRFLDLPL